MMTIDKEAAKERSAMLAELRKQNRDKVNIAQAMLKEGVTIEIDGETRVAKFGDKTLTDHVKEWAGTDEGKHFVTAANNKGGGSLGGEHQMSSEDMAKLSPMAKMTAGREQNANK